MITISQIKQLINLRLTEEANSYCINLFNESPKSYYDEDLDETYLICIEKGVSILFDDEGCFESLFFHYMADEDTEPCTLNVIGFNSETKVTDIKTLVMERKIEVLKTISQNTNGILPLNEAFILKINSVMINAEFDSGGNLALLTFMTSETYPA